MENQELSASLIETIKNNGLKDLSIDIIDKIVMSK